METAPRRRYWSFGGLLSLVILILGLVLTFLAWRFLVQTTRRQEEAMIADHGNRIESLIQMNLSSYEGLLIGTKGLFAASQDVERDEFAAYFDGLDIPNKYSGVYGFAYISRVSDSEIQAVMEKMRLELGETVKIDGEHASLAKGDDHYIVNFRVLHRDGPAIDYGADLQLDPVRKEALERAADSGQLVFSAPLVLRGPNKPGFIMTAPIYKNGESTATVEQRRAALMGWVNAAFIYEDLFNLVLSDENVGGVKVHIDDGDHLIFDSMPGVHVDLAWFGVAERVNEVGGRSWRIEFMAQPGVLLTGVETSLPTVALVSGIVMSLLLFGFVNMLSSANVRAEAKARLMAAKLGESELKFKSYMDNSPMAAWLKDPATWRYVYINKLFAVTFKVTAEDVTSKTDFDLFKVDVATALRANDERVLTGKAALQTYEDVPLPDGTKRTWLVFKFPVQMSEGKFLLGGTAVDVTDERKDHEELERMNKLMTGRELKMAEMKKEMEAMKGQSV